MSPHLLAIALFGPAHLAVLLSLVSSAVLLAGIARVYRRQAVTEAFAFGLLAIVVVNKAVSFWAAHAQGRLVWQEALPMHLCDWVTISTALTLIWRWQLAYEMAYFWGFGGTLQALLTPDLPVEFPNVLAFTFFISHGVPLVAVAFLTFGAGMRPWPRSILRAFAGCNVYLLVAAVADASLHENYGYLCHKPRHESLMDSLGPWPVYLVAMELLALLSFVVYYAPFFVADKIRERRALQLPPDG